MRRVLKGVVLVAAVAVVVVLAGPVLPRTVTHRRQFAGPVHRVVVNVGAGRVDVVADRGAGALVTDRDRFVVRRPRVLATIAEGVLNVDATCPSPLVLGCRVDLRLDVPADVGVKVTSSSGSISVRDVAGAVDLRSTAGGLDVVGLTGTVALRASAGPVTGTALAASAVTASTDAGDIHLAFSVAPDSVSALTRAGSVDMSLPDESYRVTARASTRPDVKVPTDPASPRRVDARSDAGAVRIRTAPPA